MTQDFGFAPDDPQRAERGEDTIRTVLGIPAFPADSPFRAASRDFVFSEVWSRPGLDRRARYWITLSCACAARSPLAIETYMRAALRSGEITLPELREFTLQFAIFQGFPKAAEAEIILDKIANDGAED
ncbi:MULTISPECIES: carboxymuconolactone decarboxylase family protein [unclassified Sphingobium]|uniref:carboxymuconolactone decarboxylase family protein n=1 Tax=unclassified Sphingobium TaxID=2611147 RepID=UPI0035A5DE58